MNKKILVVGESRQDIFMSNIPGLEIDQHDSRPFNKLYLDKTYDLNSMAFSVGGTGANVALTLAHWGLDVSLLSQLGDDVFGHNILQHLDQEAVETSLVQTIKKDVVNTNCAYRIFDRGLNKQSVFKYHLKQPFDLIKQLPKVDYLFCGSAKGDFKFLDELFHQAKEKNIPVMFNPGTQELADMKKTWGLLEDVDILLVNRQEAKTMLSESALDVAVKKLASFVKIAIITDAEDGVIVCDGQTIWRAGVYRPEQEIDRTGVGDAFAAGFLFKYLISQDVSVAITFGSANAASVVSKIGSQAGIIDVDAKLNSMLVRERSI